MYLFNYLKKEYIKIKGTLYKCKNKNWRRKIMRKGLKKIFLIALFSLFGINVLFLPTISTEGKTKVKFNKLQPEELQLKLNDGQIVLTADLDSEYRQYKDFQLKVGENSKKFNWRSIGNISFAPSMRPLDLGTNKNSGVGVFLVASQGTGVFIQNAHVIRIQDFKEIPIESPLDIIQRHVKTQSTDEGIVIDIDGTKTVLDKNYLNRLGIINPNQKLYYEHRIVYGTRNNTLSVDVGASNGNLTYVGNVHIDYTYMDDTLKMSKISFQKFQLAN